MSNKILALLNDPGLCNRMGSIGKNIVHEKFNLRNNVAQLVASYGLEECRQASEILAVGQLQEGAL
jgi:hypothetical protein